MSHDLQDDLHVAERELAMAQEKERQLNLKIKSISGKLRAEQDEVCELLSLCVCQAAVCAVRIVHTCAGSPTQSQYPLQGGSAQP